MNGAALYRQYRRYFGEPKRTSRWQRIRGHIWSALTVAFLLSGALGTARAAHLSTAFVATIVCISAFNCTLPQMNLGSSWFRVRWVRGLVSGVSYLGFLTLCDLLAPHQSLTCIFAIYFSMFLGEFLSWRAWSKGFDEHVPSGLNA